MRAFHHLQIAAGHFLRLPGGENLAALHQDRAAAQGRHGLHRMADEKDRAATFGRYGVHFSEALLLECRIAHGEHFIHHQNLRFQVRGDRKGQSHIHPARIALHRRVDEFFDFGKGHDLVKFAHDPPGPASAA